MAAPDPAARAVGQVAAHRRRLGIVHDHVVVVAVELGGVQLVVAVEDLPVLVGQPVRVALERVVEQLRDVEELLAPEDDLPVALEAGVAHQRDQRVEDLGHPAAHRRRAQVQHALAPERLRQRLDLLHERAADQVPVIA